MSFAIAKFSFSGALFKRILVWKQVSFQKLVSRMKLLFSLQFSICHIANIGCENVFLLVLLSKSKFFTRVALLLHLYCTRVALVSHLYRTHVAHVSLVLHSFCSCCTRVEVVPFALHSHRSCLAVVL